VVGACENGDEPSVSIKRCEALEKLSNWRFRNKSDGVRKAKRLMKFSEIITVYSENHAKQINIHSVGKMHSSVLMVKWVVHVVTPLYFKVSDSMTLLT
jgi:hypothetical protein